MRPSKVERPCVGGRDRQVGSPEPGRQTEQLQDVRQSAGPSLRALIVARERPKRLAKENGENHIAALESDAGSFRPLGFSSSGDEAQRTKMQSWKDYFLPYGIWSFDQEGGGADIGPLKDQGTLLISLRPSNQKYFIYHHTPADVFEAVDKRELELCSASMAALVYLLSEEGLD